MRLVRGPGLWLLVAGCVAACGGDPEPREAARPGNTGGGGGVGDVTGGVAVTGGAVSGGTGVTVGTGGGGAVETGGASSGGTVITGGTASGGVTVGGATGGGPAAVGGSLAGGGGSGGELATGGRDLVGGTPATGGDGTGGAEPILPELVLQEEQLGFCTVDGAVESDNAGFTGAGYANTDNVVGSAIEWGVTVDARGVYPVRLVYAHPEAERPAALFVNDAVVGPELAFPGTADWTIWATFVAEVTLEVGENRIRLEAAGDGGLANIDALTIVGDGVRAVDCAPEVTELPDLTVYVAGDSTVSTYTDTSSPADQAGWGQMLHEIFDPRVTVENRAIGGRTALWFHLEGGTAWVLDRIQPGDYFFVQFGTNDSHPTATFTVDGVTYPRLADANTDFKQHLFDYYVLPTRERGATPVLVTPPPRNSAYCGVGNSLGGYAQAMRDLGAEQDVLVLDNNQRTYDHLAAICPAPTPEDFFFVRTDGTVDGTHFQENGARAMAGFLGDEMRESSVGLYRYLLP